MKIGQILRENQPNEYKNLVSKEYISKNQEHFSTKDIEELMKHSSYKRSKGGALRQIK